MYIVPGMSKIASPPPQRPPHVKKDKNQIICLRECGQMEERETGREAGWVEGTSKASTKIATTYKLILTKEKGSR